MAGYYKEHLSGTRLEHVYDLASPRVQQYLGAELEHVVKAVQGKGRIIEFGCGYGRALKEIASHVDRAVGCDNASMSLRHARAFLRGESNCDLARMDASRTGFSDDSFDAVICIQNGISAFGLPAEVLLTEAIRVAKPEALILFSSYSPEFWGPRLEWFRDQARAGLVGEIDEERTTPGTIVCKDGFRSSTVTGDEFSNVFFRLGQHAQIVEVDRSSVFAQVVKRV
jgi:2-polyprenyl-6-hydroxyphenyl methylase/3-demethylubiquinone-9 3-methyltransferase